MADIVIVDAATGERIERDFTPEEKEAREEEVAEFIRMRELEEERLASVDEAKKSAIEKLTSLGLTQEEIQALTGSGYAIP